MVAVGSPVGTIGVGNDNDLLFTQGSVREIRSFTGYWEYLLDRAFIVQPYNPSFGGSPLVNTQGEVIGVTSLRLGEPPHVNLGDVIVRVNGEKVESQEDFYRKL